MFPPNTNQSVLIDESKHANKIDLVILDGGFGTTLETLFSQDISGPLWSARLIDTKPKLVVDAHLAFLRSGADVILTSTYQCSYSTFSRAGYTRADAEVNMRKAVTLANDARDRYLTEQAESASTGVPKIALSLGSFGATLPGGEEFGGFYPPPYGPPGKMNTFSEDQSDSEEASIRALTEFYLERLRVFLPVLDSVDYVAFETVPLRREIRAIRRAMNAFLQEKRAAVDPNGDTGIVKWWISTVWPDGLYPEVNQNGERGTSAKDVVEALLGSREGEARPWGVGVNCTFVDHLPRIVREMEYALQDLEGATLSSQKDSLKEGEDVTESKPWLIVYPNGGDVYDGHTQTWITNQEGKGERWANRVWKVVEGAIEREVWGGVVVGGCCRTGPDEISGLVELRSQKERS